MNLLTRGSAKGGTPQIMKVMKLTFILITVAMVHVSARGVSQTITFSGKDISLEKVFTEIKKQTGYVFFYDASLLRESKPVTLDLKNVPLENALEKIFFDQPLTWQMVNKTITIVKKSATVSQPADILQDFFSPPIDVHGRVVNESGDPIEGVTVTVKGTKIATATNANGEFTLTGVDEKAILVFTGVNVENYQMKVNGKNDVVASLKTKVTALQDVVINKGYYTEKQRLSTGDVGVVNAKEIQEQPVSDPIQALIGRVAGVNIQQTSGAPGAFATIRIRGQNSIANGNDPLYIVDGVPYTSQSLTSTNIGAGVLGFPSSVGGNVTGKGMSPFNSLNPSDIESIEILKDADATAIYGSRGANGVVIITTKKGSAGETRFNFEGSQGVGQVGHFMDLLNTEQYLAMRHEAFKNDALTYPSIATSPTNTDYDVNGVWDTTRYTNWQKVLIGNTAQYTNIQGNISGGNINTQFVLGAGYNRQTTVFPGEYADKKGSVHLSLTHSSSDHRFHVRFTANYVNDNSKIPQTDFTSNIILAPDAPPLYNANGNLNWQIRNGTATFFNPLAPTVSQSKAVTNNLIANLNLSYQILPGLSVEGNFGYVHMQMNQNNLQPATSSAPPNNNNPSVRTNLFATIDLGTWSIQPQINYQKKIARGQFNVLIGTTFQENILKSMAVAANGFASDALINNPQAASVFVLLGNNYTLYHYSAVYGRLGYTWEDKYLLNVTARRDGSSRFGPENQFGNFGAIGAGWIFTKEKGIANRLPWLSFGKLRASYGITGNDQLTDYQFLSTYNANSNTYQSITGLAPTGLTNPNFGWEEVKKMEIGLSLGFLKDRFNLEASYYRNQTVNQLVGEPLSSVAGFTTVQFNLPAIIQNSGLEFGLNTSNIKSKNFSWTTSANLTLPYNKLVAFPNINNFASYKNTYQVGQSLFTRHLYHYTGINSQTGLYTYATQNINGVPTFGVDQIFTQSVTQKLYGGIQNSFGWKGLRLDIFIQYVSQTGYSYQNNFNPGGFYNFNEPTAVLDRWQTPGNLSSVQRFGTNAATSVPFGTLRSSDGILTDASFLRLKNVSLSYSIPSQWQKWVHIQNGKIFVQGQNLLTITNYIGLDPETQGLTLPPLRVIAFGVSASL